MTPLWNILSLAVPSAVAILGAAIAISSRGGAGDYAGRLGSGILLIFAVGAACVFGEVAAVVSLLRGERHVWLGILGMILNFVIILPVAAALMSD